LLRFRVLNVAHRLPRHAGEVLLFFLGSGDARPSRVKF
jgi:hypothetical protein